MSARSEVLDRIRAAHRAAPPSGPAYDEITRDYPRDLGRDPDQVQPILVDRLVDYRAAVRETSRDDLAATVATALSEAGVRTLVVPSGLPGDWLAACEAQIQADGPDRLLSSDELSAVDGVLTGCRVAIAETGTVILDGAADQGRRVISLLPDFHLCVVFVDQIVSDVPDGLARVDPSRPITMISGPSATSDIELSRVEGVHGPRRLEVIIVG